MTYTAEEVRDSVRLMQSTTAISLAVRRGWAVKILEWFAAADDAAREAVREIIDYRQVADLEQCLRGGNCDWHLLAALTARLGRTADDVIS